jgi:hypothetical protein
MAAFDWTNYLILARKLGAESEESALRSAISRAYYAAYKTAEHYCENNAIPIAPTGRSHQDVWDAFLAKGGTTFNSVHEKGERLMRKRVKADYRSNVTGLQSMVLDSLRDSYAILSYLGASPPAP